MFGNRKKWDLQIENDKNLREAMEAMAKRIDVLVDRVKVLEDRPATQCPPGLE